MQVKTTAKGRRPSPSESTHPRALAQELRQSSAAASRRRTATAAAAFGIAAASCAATIKATTITISTGTGLVVSVSVAIAPPGQQHARVCGLVVQRLEAGEVKHRQCHSLGHAAAVAPLQASAAVGARRAEWQDGCVGRLESVGSGADKAASK